MVAQGDLLWSPSAQRREASRMHAFRLWLEERGHGPFEDQQALWRWSVEDPGRFWSAAWDHFGVRAHAQPAAALAEARMPGTRWFPGATLNYAEHALLRRDGAPAVLAACEDGRRRTLTRAELAAEVARVAAGLEALGVGRGDRVAAFLPNGAEAVVAFLATASLGAVWTSCSPEFGVGSVLDRFRQVEPAVLVAVDGYRYAGREHDRRAAVAQVRAGLPGLRATVLVSGLGLPPGDLAGAVPWNDLPGGSRELRFEAVPFDHPLWILYSSGTTGLPKAIVQGHGGILLEHYKALSLHGDLGEGDRFFWYTTTGWMMWNFLVSGLLVGSTILLWDGSPQHPGPEALWAFAAETGMTCFGTSAPYLMACRRAGLSPRRSHDLSRLRSVGSTGAPLPPEGFAWVYDHVSDDVLLGSMSGGTDVCTAFVLSSPLLPVHAGEIQCRGLGCAVEAFDEHGRSVVGQVGELVLTKPLPSMPTRFWGDADGSRLREAYFEAFPGNATGVWRHGDWITITERGSCVIHGRSDSTLNRGGVRMGTAELYRVVEALPEVADSLVVDTGSLEREGRLWLFVALREGSSLDEGLAGRIRAALRAELSPRHVPDEIRVIREVPRTLNGKKLEVPVKRILSGVAPERAASRDTLANPASLEPFIELARELSAG